MLIKAYYCHVIRVTVDGVCGFMIGFIDYLQIVTTSNYSAVANSRTVRFVTACTKSYQSAVSVAW
jgi:hypothetical protein